MTPSNAQSSVSISLYNLSGSSVATIICGFYVGGTHRVTFSTDFIPAGSYVYEFSGGGFVETVMMVLVS